MRLTGFDYSRPMFYMVTLKCLPGRQALSAVAEPGKCEMNPVTRAMVNAIRNFHCECPAIEPIECFTIMPDHLHLLVKIRDQLGAKLLGENPPASSPNAAACSPKSFAPKILRLETIVELLMQLLEGRYRETTGLREQVFAAQWHDWIVASSGQLAAFTRYIRENPMRWWLRHVNRRYFTQVGRLAFGGREWFAYGNPALLGLPVVEPFKCSRKWAEGGPEWRAAVARAGRIGPGGAGIGTFMSPCEKECGNAIFKAGGSLIVLSPEGFAPRWHPSRNKEALCAEGRMLFLSLYEPSAAKPDNATLYCRCHEMGDLAVAALGAKLLGETPPATSQNAAACSPKSFAPTPSPFPAALTPASSPATPRASSPNAAACSPAPAPATPPAFSPNAAACSPKSFAPTPASSPSPAPASPFKGYPQ